ncbi:MAG: hypothetical protein AVO33_03140 [delta proteobacterium ML8_F1]|nr:MAG: hypothetical protein AVO33_03140 [delta proteobacterium ML8_F1]
MSKLTVRKRTETGSNKVKKVRDEGLTPGVIYGKNENILVSFPTNELDRHLSYHGVGSRVDFRYGAKSLSCIIKDIQRNPVTRKVVHVDLQLLVEGEKIKVKIPVHVHGRENVEDKRTVVQDTLHEIEIFAYPKDLIDNISIDITGKVIGDVVTIADIAKTISAEIEILDDPDRQVVLIVKKAAEKEPEEGEETEEAVATEAADDLETL